MPETYRMDHLGSFLRPGGVRQARSAFREGRTGREELARAEDAVRPPILQLPKIVSLDSEEIYNLDIKDSQFLYWLKPL